MTALTTASVTAFLKDMVAAWNAGDLDCFCGGYAENAVYISEGKFVVGRASIRSEYKNLFTGEGGQGTLKVLVRHLRYADDGSMAVVVVLFTLISGDQEASGISMLSLAADGEHTVVTVDMSC